MNKAGGATSTPWTSLTTAMKRMNSYDWATVAMLVIGAMGVASIFIWGPA